MIAFVLFSESILINDFLLGFLIVKESLKIYIYIIVSTKILCSKTVFNIDNNQNCFLILL